MRDKTLKIHGEINKVLRDSREEKEKPKKLRAHVCARNLSETLVDRLLTVYLVSESQKYGWAVTGKVKLLKLIYLSEGRMVKDKTKGFNYDFYRWDYGPISNDALQDIKWLCENDLLKRSEYRITLTNRGEELIKNSSKLLDKNQHILEHIRRVVREFGPYTGRKIKAVVYDLPKVGEKRIIRKTERGEELLRKITDDEARKRFLVDEGEIETLLISMNKELSASLERGIKDAKEGKVKPYAPQTT